MFQRIFRAIQVGSRFLPYDRVIAPQGPATVICQVDGNMRLAITDVVVIDTGIESMKDASEFKLIRDSCHPGINDDIISVLLDGFVELYVNKYDVIIVDKVKYTIIVVCISRKEGLRHYAQCLLPKSQRRLIKDHRNLYK